MRVLEPFSPFDYYRGEVEVMLSYGCALNTVEGVLERTPLDSDQRAALWLMAWSLADGLHEEEPAVTLELVSG